MQPLVLLGQVSPPSPEVIAATGNAIRDIETIKIVIIAVVIVIGMMLSAGILYLRQRDKDKDKNDNELEIERLKADLRNLTYNLEQTTRRLDESHMTALHQVAEILRLRPYIEQAIAHREEKEQIR